MGMKEFLEAVVHRCSSKYVFKNFANFTGKHLCWSLFDKVAGELVYLRDFRDECVV